jgi:hypothetical protein
MDVEYHGFGSIAIEGTRYEHDVVLESGAVRKRDKKPSRPHRPGYGHTPLSTDEDLPWSGPNLIIGTGHSGMLPVMPEVGAEAENRGIELILLPTAEACELLKERDREDVCAVLHVTC